MRIFAVIFGAFLLLNTTFGQAETLTGKIEDGETRESIAGVNVLVKGTVLGMITDHKGEFTLQLKTKLPVTLVVSLVEYKTQEITVTSPIQAYPILSKAPCCCCCG